MKTAKTVTSATFRDTFMEETEPVEVRRYNEVLGWWVPKNWRAVLTMDEPVKKAIEPDKAKVKRGMPTKGLGEIPGVTGPDQSMIDAWSRSAPDPKPGKKK